MEARDDSLAALENDPFEQYALCDLAFAAQCLGDGETAARLLDLDDLVRVIDIAPPPGFNAAMLAALDAKQAAMAPIEGGTLVGGLRLNDTFALGPAVTRPFETMIAAATKVYLADLRAAPDHPVRAGEPGARVLVSWVNVMAAGSFERPHIHAAGWLSGVYYAEMPDLDPMNEDGAIVFGGHPFDAAAPMAVPLRVVRPRAGQMVLFPSYLTHRTRPFTGEGRRVSIAFDIQGV